MNKKNRRFLRKRLTGFTLVELLIVCSIIALLASVVMISVGNAKAKARDSKRLADVDSIAKAYRIYYDQHDTFAIQGAGAATTGAVGTVGLSDSDSVCGSGNAKCTNQGWFNHPAGSGGYDTPLNKALLDGGYLSSIFDDPTCDWIASPRGPDNSATFCYMVYFIDKVRLSVYAHTETLSESKQTTALSGSAFSGGDLDKIKAVGGANYAVSAIP